MLLHTVRGRSENRFCWESSKGRSVKAKNESVNPSPVTSMKRVPIAWGVKSQNGSRRPDCFDCGNHPDSLVAFNGRRLIHESEAAVFSESSL